MPGIFLNLDRDPTLANNSDEYIASQKAVKTALDLKANQASLEAHVNDVLVHMPDPTGHEGELLKVQDNGVPGWDFIIEFKDHTAG